MDLSGSSRMGLFFLRPGLEFAQIVGDLGAGPVDCADEFAPDYSLAIDDVALRPAEGAVEAAGFARWVANSDHVDAVVFEEFVISGVVFVDTDGEHDYSFTFEEALQADEGGRFFDAGGTPGGPEIQHHDLSAKLAERDFVVGILHGKVGRGSTDAAGTAAAVAGGEE